MPQPCESALRPTLDDEAANTQKPAAAVGNVPFTLVLLSLILVLIPWTRTAGLVLVFLLAIPALIAWVRARKLADGS